MGLDQYAFMTTTTLTQIVDFPEPETIEKLHYWRKNWGLHGWMEQLYRRKGGKDEHFNMSPVVINRSDLDELEREIRASALPEPSVFFSGNLNDFKRDDDLVFIDDAREAIAAGKTVFYVGDW